MLSEAVPSIDGLSSPPRVVLLVDSPFSKRNRARFGAEVLHAAGFALEVWDVSPWLRPAARKQWYERPSDVTVLECADEAEFKSLCTTLRESDVVILIAGVSKVEPPSYLAIWRQLSNTKARLTTITSGSGPSPRLRHRILAARVRIRKEEGSGVRLIVKFTHRKFAAFLEKIRNPGSRSIAISIDRDRALDCIWAGTGFEEIRRELIDDSTLITFIHALDYDLVLDARSKEFAVGSAAVFLDSMGPIHPDYQTLNITLDETMSEYSSLVCRILDQIESENSLQVIIAAHPRAEPGVLEPWYGGRPIVYGRTAIEVARSQFVIAVDPSTSIGMAVEFAKPIILVHSTKRDLDTQIWMRVLADTLSIPLLSGDNPKTKWTPPVVNLDAYERYRHRAIKRPGTPEAKFWSVVTATILS